jgi:hypothetical protein
MIALDCGNAYVNEVTKILNLTNKGARWLTTALPPHMAGLTTKALVIADPIRRQAMIELGALGKGPSLTQKPRPLNIQPHRQRFYVIEKLNCSLETYGYRGRQTVRGFTSRALTKGINPLTKPHKQGREKLIKK